MAWYPYVPPEIAAIMNKGNYAEGFKKGATEVGKQIIEKGPRIIKPIAQISKAALQAGGLFPEGEAVAAAGEFIALSPQAAVLATSARLALGWESIVAGGIAVVESPLIVPVLLVGLGFMFAWSMNHLPKSSEPMVSVEYRRLHWDIAYAQSRFKVQPGKAG